MKITGKTQICMVIGDPVEHSLSPLMHNAGYEALKIESEFAYLGTHVKPENLEDFVKLARTMRQIRGVSITLPHKLEIMKHLDEIDEVAKKIGAVNTVVKQSGLLKGYNTDWIGVVAPLEKMTSLENKKVALIGAGGAARAAAYGITQAGAKLSIFNRTIDKAEALAEDFDGDAFELTNLDQVRNMDVVINASSVGLHPNENDTPIPIEYINSRQIVYDLAYGLGYSTRVIKEADKKGAKTLSGTEMLLAQGLSQFELFTNRAAPEEAMRKALL